MSRRPARFTQADLNRAIKAAKQNGMGVEVLADGTIRIVPAPPVNYSLPERLAAGSRIEL